MKFYFKQGMTLAGCVAAMVGCGGPNTFEGKVDGNSMDVQEAIYAPLYDESNNLVSMLVIMADQPNLCESLNENRSVAGATYLYNTLMRLENGELVALTEGRYEVKVESETNANIVVTKFSKFNNFEVDTLSEEKSLGRDGSVDITRLPEESGGLLEGSFDITFGAQGDKVSGRFEARLCDLKEQTSTSTGE